jgi:hypothetical protein
LNNYINQDYLGDLKASYRLIERIKSYYVSRGISLNGVKFWVDKTLDSYGSKVYSIRSNLVHNLNTMALEVTDAHE